MNLPPFFQHQRETGSDPYWINWFELPVGDLERATAFWSVVMSSDLITMDGPDGEMRAFTSDAGACWRTVASGENNPSSNGVRIYLMPPATSTAF